MSSLLEFFLFAQGVVHGFLRGSVNVAKEAAAAFVNSHGK
jgi:hypothetical protein